jgi:para-aminobenzoate synthetase component I
MNRDEAIIKMNLLGSQQTPFLFIIDYTMKDCLVLSPDEAVEQNILFHFNNYKNFQTEETNSKVTITTSNPIPYPLYEQAFRFIQQQIMLGNSYLVNLTFPTPISVNGSLSELFHASKAKYKLVVNDRFVVFSPETFVNISNGIIGTYPMKGTIDASLPGALESILSNEKEMAEHATVVDLLRNDLSCVAENVKVEKYRYAEEIVTDEKKLLQISSKIVGELPPDYRSRLGSIIFEMLPAGSVTGAPKNKTLEIIAEAEKYDRGFYTGIAGYFDGENLDSSVLIRFIENIDGQLVYKSGGGITSQSLPEKEYKELIDKIYVPIS